MEKSKLKRLILTAGIILGNALLWSESASAANCNAFGNQGGGCPTVQSLTVNGGSVAVNWATDLNAQTFASIETTRAATWGLYMIYGWTTSMNGHWFGGGTRQPIMTVSNTDPVRKADGSTTTDNCTDNPFYCTHQMMAARFYQKYGFSGTASVALPPSSSYPAHAPPCLIFGAMNPGTGDFYTVFAPGLAEPCKPGFPGTVEPEPDPEWCGMSTGALDFKFGDMAPGAVSGQSITGSATMACSDAGVTYSLYLSNVSTIGRDTVDLGRGVTAKVTVNNQALQTNRVSTGKTNNLNVTVTLNGTPTSTGPIGGTGILAVNYL